MTTIIYYLSRIIAVIFVFAPHEFAHAYVAYKNGDPTAKVNGRMTLNPIKHIDPLGFVLCALVGFGWAKPVPINPDNFRKRKTGLFTTAIAGVVANYLVAFLAYLIYIIVIKFLGVYLGVSIAANFWITFLYTVLYIIFSYSVYSVVFNLLPLYPLDGFRVIQSFTREINPVRRFLKKYSQPILIVLLVWSFVCGILDDYVAIFTYFDVFYYLGWFARNIIAFPITIAWDWILKV